MPKETWATGGGKPPRRVKKEDYAKELKNGADLRIVDTKVVKMKQRGKDAKATKKAEETKDKKGKT